MHERAGQSPSLWATMQEGAEDAKGVPEVAGRKPQRFIPFSIGARDCVGQTLARLNLSTTLAQLYGSFTFKLAAEVRCSTPSLHTASPAGSPLSSLTFLQLQLLLLNLRGVEAEGHRSETRSWKSGADLHRILLQMGGPEGVRANEITSITLSCAKGMKVHAVARVKA